MTRRRDRRTSSCPTAPRPLTLSERQRWLDATTYEAGRQLGTARHTAGSALGALRRLAVDPVGVGTDALRTAGRSTNMLKPATDPLSPLMTGRSLSVRFDTIRVPLGGLKLASKVVSGRLNDGFVAGITGGFRRYHQHHGYDQVEALRMAMPVNVRTAATASSVGNHFVPARFLVPIGLDDPIARMTAIRELVAQQRAEPALAMTEPLAGILNRLPDHRGHRHLRLDAQGRRLHHQQRARAAHPGVPGRGPAASRRSRSDP